MLRFLCTNASWKCSFFHTAFLDKFWCVVGTLQTHSRPAYFSPGMLGLEGPGLGLEGPDRGLGLECPGLGLEGPGLVNIPALA